MTTLTNFRLWDGVSGDIDAGIDTMAFDGGRITAIGASGDFELRNAINLEGATVMPGLIDAHVHLCLDPDDRDPLAHTKLDDDDMLGRMRVRARDMVRTGITTARDLGGGRWLELSVRDEIAAGKTPGPRLLCAGQPITTPAGHCHFWGGVCQSDDDIETVLARQIGQGVDLIKVMATGGSITPDSRPVDSQFDRAALEKIVSLASANDRHVAAHCHGTNGIRDAAAAAIATIEHCSWVGDAWGSDYDDETAREIAAKGLRVSPTISLGWQRRLESDWDKRMCRNFAAMKASGVEFIASTDAGIPGVRHADLAKAIPVQANYLGLTPVGALQMATSQTAAAIGLGAVTGRLAPGFDADVLVVDGDPLTDLACLAVPVNVFARGVSVL